MKKTIYAGSFNPITNGHLDIIRKASNLFDEIIILLASNSYKNDFLKPSQREYLIRDSINFCGYKNVSVFTLDITNTVIDYAKTHNCNYLIRGLRNFYDLNYEQNIYNINKNIDNSIETIFFMPELENSMISSSNVRELYKYKKFDVIEKYVPKTIFEFLTKKK